MSNAGSTLIDAVSAAYPAMAQFYASDWYVLEARNEGYCVVAGCAISASGTAGKVDMSAGIVSVGNADLSVSAVTAVSTTITSLADATNPKWVALEVDTSGTLNFNAGTAAANPQKPTPTSARVVVAWLYVPATATAVDALTTNTNGKAKIIEARQLTPQQPVHSDWPYVLSGCAWTGDALGSTRAASMSAGIIVIAGLRLRVAAVTSRTFTASKDTYVDLQDNSDGTASITYTEVSNNAASPALPNSGTVLNTLRNAIVITGASVIASATVQDGSVGALNQGSCFSVLPIASSIAYTVTDSLGNLIYNTTPQPKLLGYRQIIANFTSTSTSVVVVTGLSCPVNFPAAGVPRRIRVKFVPNLLGSSNASTATSVLTYLFVAGTEIEYAGYQQPNTVGNFVGVAPVEVLSRVGAGAGGALTFDARVQQTAAGTITVYATNLSPSWIAVYLE